MEKTYGWTGQLLRIELPSGKAEKTKTMDYAQDFIGGRTLAARIYWNETPKSIGALDPENMLMIMSGPLGGTQATACSRWVMTAKSPQLYPDQYGFGNAGGFMGAAIKFAGYDGILIQGKAKTHSYILIENEKVELKDAQGLWGLTSDDTIQKLKERHGNDAHLVCIGPAGENLVRFAIAFTEQGGTISSGIGAVMGSKNIKAIVVKGSNKVPVADPEKISEINKRIRSLRKGLNESVYMTEPMLEGIEMCKPTPCYACPAGCARATYKHTSGLTEVRKTCAAAYFYTPWDQMYHGKGTDSSFLATSLCDQFGLDTGEMSNIMNWLYKCHKKGILTEGETGLPLSKIGSLEFMETLVDMTTKKRGFGELLSQGTRRASIAKGKAYEEVGLERVTPSGYVNDSYGARVFLITSLFYATEPRNPIIQLHEVNFLLLKWALWYTTGGSMSPVTTEDLRRIAKRIWGSEKAVDFSTYDGKAMAAFLIQNRQHAKETMVACDRYFPIMDTDQKEDHIGDPTFEVQLFEAVTGKKMDYEDYLRLGERSFNLQRAILGREGRGGRKDDILNEFNFTVPVETSDGVFGMFNPDLELPGPGDQMVVRKGKTVDRAEFERMKDEYYALRGWDVASGLQTKKKLEELKLGFVAGEMERLGLLASK
jgi:aldehyde:ferredoxin oxidoreductase